MKLLSRLFAVFCLAAALTAPAAAAYPEKPINMVIAFTAGGSSDVQARIMQKYWNKYAPQPWVFVYKPGAGGIIGFTEIAKARPDGYTIGGLNVPHLIVQSLAQNAQYTPDSFKYICQVVNDPQCVAVRKDSPFKTTQEIIDHARKNPGSASALSGRCPGIISCSSTGRSAFPTPSSPTCSTRARPTRTRPCSAARLT